MSKSDELTRRKFITNAAHSYLGVSLAPFLAGALTNTAFGQNDEIPGGKAKSVIYLNMSGGMSHIDTFDPKPDKKEVQGPIDVINSKADGIQLTSFLPNIAKIADKLCIINSMSTTQGAHAEGQYAMLRSYDPRGTVKHPVVGSWAVKMAGRENANLPGFVSIGGGNGSTSPGFFSAKHAGIPLGSPEKGLQDITRAKGVSEDEFQKRLALADVLNQNFHNQFSNPTIDQYDDLYEEALRVMQSKDLKAFDIRSEPDKLKQQYGKNNFGQGCLLARRLVEHNVRFVQVSLGGWDTHYDNFAGTADKSAILDQAYSTLINDLASRGLLETTLVVLTTEFGRTPTIKETRKMGRDHYPAAYSSVLAGGGVQGGTKYGETNETGTKIVKDKMTPGDMNATIGYALGINTDTVITSPEGRPFKMGNKGKAVTKIF
ncbi:DUF1501 domain-containing protein [Akkermansiaceae bacterium]|nr:DUF1501 domain-containing protein [Akkermansiaceae bacterium]